MVRQGGSVQLGDIDDDQSWGREGTLGGSPYRVDGWWQNNETFAGWQEWMAHVISVEEDPSVGMQKCNKCEMMVKTVKNKKKANCTTTDQWGHGLGYG